MPSLTLAIDEALLKEARIKALKEDTSVNEICRKAIEAFVGRETDAQKRVARLRETFSWAQPRAPGEGPAWQGRDWIYEERLNELERRRRRK